MILFSFRSLQCLFIYFICTFFQLCPERQRKWILEEKSLLVLYSFEYVRKGHFAILGYDI